MTDVGPPLVGDGGVAAGLADVVKARIVALEPAVRDALAVVAVGGPLPQEPAIQALGLEAVLALERAQLVRICQLEGGPDVRLADPRYRDIVLDAPGVDRDAAATAAAAIVGHGPGDGGGPAVEDDVTRLLAGVIADGRATRAERCEAHLLLGATAAEHGALRDADEHLVQAVELATTPALFARAVVCRVEALADHDGRHAEASAVLQAGLRDLQTRWPSAADTATWTARLVELLPSVSR